MSLLIESIKLLDGVYHNLFYHEQRMTRSLRMLCGVDEEFNLEEFLKRLPRPEKGLYKCRIVYDDVMKEVEFIPYKPAFITTLKIIESDRISYEHKYLDRAHIDRLYTQRSGCDDILIIKNDLVTDTSYCNIVFRRNNLWYTPWSPLLPGTMRQHLIERGIIFPETIQKEDIRTFHTFRLINAMLEFSGPEIDVSNIVF